MAHALALRGAQTLGSTFMQHASPIFPPQCGTRTARGSSQRSVSVLSFIHSLKKLVSICCVPNKKKGDTAMRVLQQRQGLRTTGTQVRRTPTYSFLPEVPTGLGPKEKWGIFRTKSAGKQQPLWVEWQMPELGRSSPSPRKTLFTVMATRQLLKWCRVGRQDGQTG